MTTMHKLPHLDVAQIAKVCHEANRAYCQTNGDLTHGSWEEISQERRDGMIKGVIYRLNNPGASQEATHVAWCESKKAEGWKFGAKKNEEEKIHPCLVPYEQLPITQQLKDTLFGMIVNSFLAVANANVVANHAPGFALRDVGGDPNVAIKNPQPLSGDLQMMLSQLGFRLTPEGRSYVYSYCGRAIYVDSISSPAEITLTICQEAEAIGERKKTNEIRQALDIPLGIITEAKPGQVS
jgi:hypothetical protein